MIERFEENLQSDADARITLTLRTRRLIDCIIRNADLVDDRRIRELRLLRMSQAGDWGITCALSFEGLDGSSPPFPSFIAPTKTPKTPRD